MCKDKKRSTSMKRNNTIVLTEEQKQLIKDCERYNRICYETAGEVGRCSDGFHDNAALNLQATEKKLVETGFPYEEIPYVKKARKQAKRDEFFNRISEVVFYPVEALFLSCYDVAEKIHERKMQRLHQRGFSR